MIKLSNKGIYGIKALYELACNFGGDPLTIREISSRQNLPVPFLEQVLNQLKREGLVKSRRGTRGGYLLSRNPREITIGDAVRAIEGPIALCSCLQSAHTVKSSRRMTHCVTSDLYRRLSSKVEKAFDSVTLSELTGEKNETSADPWPIACRGE
ncbi:MAG: Rrf2 family transcriptional regulator [Candidatus Latescibacteria bacterium]|nr:Rrf2 family transcriptional regulator [Candidatus Latescibacterota bacterium]